MLPIRVSLPAALSIAAALGLPLRALAQDDTPLPIRTITLYRSGVGAFERTGTIGGDAAVSLRFQTEQINDILKSLVVLDRTGGSVGTVSYASNEPLARRLDAFRINIADNPSVPQLLDRLRGEKVSLDTVTGPIAGTILGVEERFTTVTAQQEPGFLQEPYVSLVTERGIQSVAVSQVRSFELQDADLAEELSRALSMLAEHRADRATSVDLSFSGGGGAARDVYVAYVHEMPVWKTTYRLVLPEKAEGKPVVQGWAIVENTTDQDWKDVRLSLASGRPVAFQMDLYQPLFAFRPMVPVPFAAGLAPRIYEAGVGADFLAKGLSDREIGAAAEGFDSTMPRRMIMPQAAAAPPADFSRANEAAFGAEMQSLATSNEIGEQFFFTLDMPVSVERQRSAMVPILTEEITGERVSIYSAQTGGTNPMRGVRLTNDSGMALMPGPVAVYDGSAYAGDAQIPHSARNDTQLLAYAADLDVTVNTDSRSDETINSLKIVSGLVVKEVTRTQSTTFAFENNDAQRDRTIIIENPRMGMDWETVEPTPIETTDELQRFRTTVPRGETSKTTITQKRVERSSMAVTSYDRDTVMRFSNRGKMSPAVTSALLKAADMQAAINAIDEEIRRIDEEIASITNDQDRIRKNMGSIDRNSDLYARYLKSLTEQETRLDQIRIQREDAVQRKTTQERELQNYVRNLSVE